MKFNIFSKSSKDKQTSETNPYLNAKRTWNEHISMVVSSLHTWQLIGILALLIALSSIAGIIYIGSQSKVQPYLVEVDKLGRFQTVGYLPKGARVDARILHSTIADFVNNARMVTLDAELQRRAIFKVFSFLSAGDPATAKMTEDFNKNNRFERARKELVTTEIVSVLPQSSETWQAEWIEKTFARDGSLQKQEKWRALINIYQSNVTPQSEDQIRTNPLGLFIRDYSWSKIN